MDIETTKEYEEIISKYKRLMLECEEDDEWYAAERYKESIEEAKGEYEWLCSDEEAFKEYKRRNEGNIGVKVNGREIPLVERVQNCAG